ncbi:MAG: hypothetical protein CMD34_01175 [Flavobacteriales bacterium]|nr:hypothetical protein [Flavobacteriales bacterium]
MTKLSLKILFIISLVPFASCKKDEIISNQKITIKFSHTVDGIDLPSCCSSSDTLSYTNPYGEKYSVDLLKYIISNLKLHTNNGDSVSLSNVHFINLSEESTLNIEIRDLNLDNYSSLSFVMGLNSEMNTENNFINSDFHSSMWWPTQGSGTIPSAYHYMKLEGSVDSITKGYKVHTGPTMGGDYSFRNELPILLNLTNTSSDVEININMEINNWFQNPSIISLPTAMMMDMSKQMQLKENGKEDVFSASVLIR